MFKSRSIGVKLLRKTLFIVGSAWLVLSVGMIYKNYNEFEQYEGDRILSIAMIISETLPAALAFDDRSRIQETVFALKSMPQIVKVLVKRDEEVIATYTPEDMNKPALWEERWQRVISRPVIFGEDKIGEVIILYSLQSSVHDFLSAAIILLLISILIFYVSYLRLSKSIGEIVMPVNELSNLMSYVTKNKDYSVRAKLLDTGDEVANMTACFNDMLSKVQERDEKLLEYSTNLESIIEQRTSELIKAKDAAERASLAKGMFLANMSHEIRTPMNAIIGLSDIALESGANMEQQREYLTMIRDSANSLLMLLSDILDLSKIESGKVELELKPFSIRRLIEEIAGMFRLQAMKKSISLIVRINDNLPDYVICDVLRMRQVLVNLMSNAFKFTGKGEVEIGAYSETSEGEKLIVHFFVRDTGIGISSEKINEIFDSFTQEDSTITRRYGGTGLGLNICKKLAELMGGRIWVESEKGVGSVFHMELPLVKTESTFKEGETDRLFFTKKPAKRLKVLVVEDNEINQIVTRLILVNRGHEVSLASGGLEALEFLRRDFFDIVLMDVQMPEVDGITATRLIRDGNGVSNPRVPIIALSAHAMLEDKRRCLEAGMDDYLTKPLKIADLVNSIESRFNVYPLKDGPQERPQEGNAGEVVVEKKETDSIPILDKKLLDSNYGFDEEMIASIMQNFLKYVAYQKIQEIRDAIAQGDMQLSSTLAHTLKGAAATGSARFLSNAAYDVERALKEGDIEKARSLLPALDRAFNITVQQIKQDYGL